MPDIDMTGWFAPPVHERAEMYEYDDQLRRIPPVVKFRIVHPGAREPKASFEGDAGFDLFTCENTVIPAGGWCDIPVGIQIQPPEGYWVRLVGRSSTFRRRGLSVIEGVVDNGYRGDIYFGVWNPHKVDVVVNAGERIAQAILHPIIRFPWTEVEKLEESIRQGAGFGSTGE